RWIATTNRTRLTDGFIDKNSSQQQEHGERRDSRASPSHALFPGVFELCSECPQIFGSVYPNNARDQVETVFILIHQCEGRLGMIQSLVEHKDISRIFLR